MNTSNVVKKSSCPGNNPKSNMWQLKKTPTNVLMSLQLTENGHLLEGFPEMFQKMFAKRLCKRKQIR